MEEKNKIKRVEVVFHSPLEKAVREEMARLESEGFKTSAQCLKAALYFIREAEKKEYDEWRRGETLQQN